MLKKVLSTYLLLVMTAVATGLPRLADATPVVVTTDSRSVPAAPAAPVSGNAATTLSASQMSATKGDGIFGWLKKIWKKFKKTIIKVIWTIVKEIIEEVISETTSSVEGISGTVTEVYEGNEQTERVYASQADYDNNNLQSSSYYDGGYNYSYTDTSSGHFEY